MAKLRSTITIRIYFVKKTLLAASVMTSGSLNFTYTFIKYKTKYVRVLIIRALTYYKKFE
jgi:hypothetical protein